MKTDNEKLIAILQDDCFTCNYLPSLLYAVEFMLLPKPVPLHLSENFYPMFSMKALQILIIKYNYSFVETDVMERGVSSPGIKSRTVRFVCVQN